MDYETTGPFKRQRLPSEVRGAKIDFTGQGKLPETNLSIPSEILFAEPDHFKTERVVVHVPALLLIEHFEPGIKLAASSQSVRRSALKSVGVTIIEFRQGGNFPCADHGPCNVRNSSAALRIS